MKHLLLTFLMSLPSIVNAADELASPKGEVILEVSGAIEFTNANKQAHFDRAMIEALPSGEIVTSNHVINKPATYTGPKLEALLKRLGAKGNTIRITALDEYTTQISRKDIEKYGVLIATHENGKLLTLDDRGPFFVVFPFDENKELQKDHYYNMSVWQVMSIEVE